MYYLKVQNGNLKSIPLGPPPVERGIDDEEGRLAAMAADGRAALGEDGRAELEGSS